MPRRVLITGASRGIGKAIAEVYKREGWEVLAPGKDELDIANSEHRFWSWHHGNFKVDAFVNSAGVGIHESFQEIFRVNFFGAESILGSVVNEMQKKKFGRIVMISSCSSLLGRGEKRLAYSAAKAGVNSLVRTCASEYSHLDILANAVCPGFVDTDMTNQNLSFTEQAKIKKQIPIGRFAKPEEIAEFVYFLGSEKNTYITGQVIPIDGGYTTCR